MAAMSKKLLDYLKKAYKPGAPIFAKDIEMNPSSLRAALKRLVDEGSLKRFEPGIYYIPGELVLDGVYLGELCPDTGEVACAKYLTSI